MKENINKIKKTFIRKKVYCRFIVLIDKKYDYFYYDYPERKNKYYRKMKTKQERTLAVYHEKEYSNEYNFKVRGKRNFTNLPNSYDDILSNLMKDNKSWKKISKRKKQYKLKKEA